MPTPTPTQLTYLAAASLQNSDSNKKKLAAMNGIDALLQAIAPYRNR